MDLEVPRSSRGSCTIIKNVSVERLRASGALSFFEVPFCNSVFSMLPTCAIQQQRSSVFCQKSLKLIHFVLLTS